MILMIDNYDSFTYNVVQLISKLGYEVKTVRNDAITLTQIQKMKPTHIVISPGPGTPKEAGMSLSIIAHFAGKVPILGVCLGHQCIIEAFGGDIIGANRIVHGKTSKISHDNKGIFRNILQNFEVVRYHSLAGDPKTIPDCLEVTALSVDDDTIMGIRHKNYQVVGVQFHPESIGSEMGEQLIRNFFNYKLDEPVKVKLLGKVCQKESLTAKEASLIMDEITSGELTDSQLGAFLGSLAVKGVSPTELSSFVSVLRSKTGVNVKMSGLLDTCGTGGDGKHTFNVSSAAALVCASCGVKVAKHGNRAITSKSGSFDFLNHLNIKTEGDLATNLASIKNNNFAFFFAPKYHSAMRFVGKVRQEIKVRTVFNMIGPLANPMPLDYQLVGVFSKDLLDLFAESMKQLGRKHAMVVHSFDGLDEISITDKTMVRELKPNGEIAAYEIDPKDFGIKGFVLSDFEGISATDNVNLFKQVISKKTISDKKVRAVKSVIALNAGAALYLAGKAKDIKSGYALALKQIESGAVKRYIDRLVTRDQ